MSDWNFKVGDRVQISTSKDVVPMFRGKFATITEIGEIKMLVDVEIDDDDIQHDIAIYPGSQRYLSFVSSSVPPSESSLIEILDL